MIASSKVTSGARAHHQLSDANPRKADTPSGLATIRSRNAAVGSVVRAGALLPGASEEGTPPSRAWSCLVWSPVGAASWARVAGEVLEEQRVDGGWLFEAGQVGGMVEDLQPRAGDCSGDGLLK